MTAFGSPDVPEVNVTRHGSSAARSGMAGGSSSSEPQGAHSVGPSQPEALSAGQVMRRDIPHAAPESTIGALLPLLSGPGAHAVPILNRGRIRGIVTQTDLIAALARQLLRPRAAPPA